MIYAKVYQPLSPFLKSYGWALPVIIGLGISASAAESVGIGLFLPLLQNSTSSKVQGVATRLLNWLPADRRSLAIAALIVAALLLKAGISYANALLAAKVNLRVGHDLRSLVFSHLLNSGYAFLAQNEWGKLLETLSTETWRTTQALSCAISAVTAAGTMAILGVLLIFVSPWMALLIAAGMLLLSVSLRGITRPVRRAGDRAVLLNGQLGEQMVDGIFGLRTIHAFHLQKHMQREFDRSSHEVNAAFLEVEAWSSLVSPFAEISSSVLLLGLILFAGAHTWNWPSLLVAVMIVYRIQTPFKQFETARVSLAGLTGAAENVSELLARSGTGMERGGRPPIRALRRSIALENVTFFYPGTNQPALSDLTISIPRGKLTAVVGLSGAGKTTLLNLLCGFHQPAAGRIVIDGEDLSQFDPESWRERIAVAGQDVHLFNTTARENIRCGRLDASDEEILRAAQSADADEFIRELPRGYETRIGDNGMRISGGQRQRIALARAFLRRPEILIMDEATNALDSISEQSIQVGLEQLGRDCTMIVAAHRFSTIERADQVIVLEHGKLVEQGSPSALLKRDGVFRRLHTMQALMATS